MPIISQKKKVKLTPNLWEKIIYVPQLEHLQKLHNDTEILRWDKIPQANSPN